MTEVKVSETHFQFTPGDSQGINRFRTGPKLKSNIELYIINYRIIKLFLVLVGKGVSISPRSLKIHEGGGNTSSTYDD